MTDATSDERRRVGAYARRAGGALRSLRVLGLLVLVIAIGAGCGGPSVSLNQDRSAFEEEENRLEQRLSDHPKDGEALRDLGSIYLRTDRPAQAYDVLKKGYSQRPDDPKVLFYLGLASEKVGRQEAALKLFQRFDEVPEDSKYRTLMEGRYEWLARKEAKQEVQRLIAQEKNRPADVAGNASPNTIAVVPMEYQGGDDKYQALGRGLAEMFTTDLANVRRLKVVERVRLQAILNELKLAQSEYVDQSTAPRVGRLLGAGRLVGGSYLVTGGEELRLQVTLANVVSGERQPQLERQRAGLDELFDLQKEVTFSIVDQLGVELTAQERAAIQEVPTQNIQAFLAYSRGLMEEDRGNFGAASRYYQQAHQIDPDFDQAAKRQEKAAGMETAGGSQGKAVAASQGDPQQAVSSSSIDLVGQRLRNMGASPSGSSSDDEGEEDRDPLGESSTAAKAAELDDPPDPPATGGN